jgi:GntR family transcriptional regulator
MSEVPGKVSIINLDRSSPVPIYQQVKRWMRHRIEQGIWPEHYKLLNEIDLANEIGVSRGTIRKAVSELIEEGLLVRIHGRGTFIASKQLEQPLAERLVAFSEDLIEKGIPFETKVLEQQVIEPDERIASLLSIVEGRDVFFLKRIRYVAHTPIILLHNYVVYDRCVGIEELDFTQWRLFQALEERFGLVLDWGRRTFEAQIADRITAQQLDIIECAPVMNMEQIVFLDDGSPIELSDLWMRGEHYRLTATVRRIGITRNSIELNDL